MDSTAYVPLPHLVDRKFVFQKFQYFMTAASWSAWDADGRRIPGRYGLPAACAAPEPTVTRLATNPAATAMDRRDFLMFSSLVSNHNTVGGEWFEPDTRRTFGSRR
ncbi:hypothetical protein GCM10029964_094620 [Kibdelosporangium lantanae]